MNQYAMEDTPLDYTALVHVKFSPRGQMWICKNEQCDGVHHFYVRAHPH
jgi:hypothetical protein